VSVLLGNGDGIFQAAVNYGVGSPPFSVPVGDFNGDGKPDLAVANTPPSSNGAVTIVLNTTPGSAKKATSTMLTSSLNPSSFGRSVTFTATVSSAAGTPTGTVTFYDGAITLGTGALNASGQATFTTAALTTVRIASQRSMREIPSSPAARPHS